MAGGLPSLLVLATAAVALARLSGPLSQLACNLPYCNCYQFSRLHCQCASPHQVVELKQEGYGYLPLSITSITVENCGTVIVYARCLEQLKSLRVVRLSNLAQLILQENAFSWDTTLILDTYTSPGINIEIVNTSINNIPSNAFMGHISNIVLHQVRIGDINAFAFSHLAGTERIEFTQCQITKWQPQAFKKFIVDHLIIEDGYIAAGLPSFAVKDVTVKQELKLEGVDLGEVKSLAVTAQGPTVFRIKKCFAKAMEGEAWRVVTRGPVFVESNVFPDLRSEAFLGVSVDPVFRAQAGRQELVFENNTLVKFENWALAFNTSGLKPGIDRLVLRRQCSCPDINKWTSKLVKYVDWGQVVTPNVSKLVWCYEADRDVVASEYYRKICQVDKYTLFWIVGSVIALVILLATCFACFFIFTKWKKMYKEVKTNRELINENRLSTYSQNSGQHVIVLPSKMYLETEIDIFQEQAEPLRSAHNDVSEMKVTGL